MTTTYHRDFDRLCALLKERGPIAFSMRLAQITGHPKDAVLLSQLVYWTRHGRDVVARQGWIHKTREQWFEETGLSREEQENARRRLRRLTLAQEWRGGRPARLYFRIHTGTLSTALSHAHRLEQPVHLSLDFMRDNEHAMHALFGPSVAFHRVLVEVTGSVNAALMLSRMIQLQRHTLDTDGQWFSLTASEWARDCGLKRRQFENAKHKLRQLGLIEEFVSHERHRRVFSRVHPVRLLELLRPIIQRVSSAANVTRSVSDSGRTASSGNAANIVQTLDRRNGVRLSRSREHIDDSLQTLDTRKVVRMPSLHEANRNPGRKQTQQESVQPSRTHEHIHDSVQTLDRKYGVRTCSIFDNRSGAVQTPERQNSVRLCRLGQVHDVVQTLDTQNCVRPIPVHDGSRDSVKTLDTHYRTLPSPVHDSFHGSVQTLDRRYRIRTALVHEASCTSVKTLGRQYGVRPSPAREVSHDAAKTLDTQNGGRRNPLRDRIDVQKSLTNFSQPEKSDGEKRTWQSAGFVHGSRRETYIANARAYTTTSTNTPTTTAPHGGTAGGEPLLRIDRAGDAEPVVVVGKESAIAERQPLRQADDRDESDNPVITFESQSLIWPGCVHAAERQPIARHLARVPQEARQIMLDEMAACHRQHPVKWPVAYVGSLVKRYQVGDFIPAKAHIEREHRRLAAVRQLALREREEQFSGQLPPVSSPETARHNLAVLRDALRQQWGKSGGKRD